MPPQKLTIGRHLTVNKRGSMKNTNARNPINED